MSQPIVSRQWEAVKVDGARQRDLVLSKATIPPPGPDEVLVRVHAVSVNFTDLLLWTGVNQAKPRIVPCSDMSGQVISLGPGVTTLKQGDRVTANRLLAHLDGEMKTSLIRESATGSTVDGVLTEYRTFPAAALVIIPEHLSYEEGATLSCTGVTAYNCLFGDKPVKQGDSVLVLGTGSVSLFAAQFAKAVGADVIFTSSSDKKIARLKEMGYTKAVNYKTHPRWHLEVLKLTNSLGVTHVIENGGAGTLCKSVECVSMGGTVHLVGFLDPVASKEEDTDEIPHSIAKNYVLRGVFVGPVTVFREMNQFITEHKLRPIVDRVFDFEDVSQAYEYLSKQVHMGKVVIRTAAGASSSGSNMVGERQDNSNS
jgi:NADPH:quinone reductase-like Zn-dependent oxidoreductase